MKTALTATGSALFALASAQSNNGNGLDANSLLRDPGTYGPEIELVHLYAGDPQFPTGITVSREGRLFSNYPGALDPANTNNGTNGRFTIAELINGTSEIAWPSVEINNPPGGAINYTTTPPTGANYEDYLIGSQSIVIDAANRAWILDTGRVALPNGVIVNASPGGAKLIGVHLNNDTVFQTIVFPPTVAYPDSYLNDLRIDLNPNVTESGKGIIYITDSSLEGRNGIVMADIGTGETWRHLDGNPAVRIDRQFVFSLWGNVAYGFQAPSGPFAYTNFGADGIALSADGETLFWKNVAGRNMYSILTERLRDRSNMSEWLAQSAIRNWGETGVSDGLETDTNNLIYHAHAEANAVAVFNPANASHEIFVRDPRINWADTLSVGWDGYLYFTNNQLPLSAGFAPGTDRRQPPYSLLRVPLPNNGSKIGVDVAREAGH
ncbi:Putative major royal jelly protein/protein yellow [Septoria linicola]|uniref:Major royal jelly protein/protein yellow n=1 Tax=Septoria linicola TaxID=215465 RepID=A0A9Q9AXC8_9PEZI|nr:putative major royal jelly protein/protein yellow [Septoria linicola]USW56870.1 Putative major royal jelly protein/protein yellow [Septoria linicola]